MVWSVGSVCPSQRHALAVIRTEAHVYTGDEVEIGLTLYVYDKLIFELFI